MIGIWAALLAGGAQMPPPIVFAVPPDRPVPALQRWTAGEAICGGVAQPFAVRQRPAGALAFGPVPAPVTLRFRIDATGRPLGISRSEAGYMPFGDDLVPSFVASRFAPGTERQGCTIEYRAVRTPIAQTPVDELIAFTMTPDAGLLPKEGWDRINGAASTCTEAPRPEPLLRAYPAFRRLPATPGARDWSMIGYDLDAAGRPVRVRHVTGTGNAALDAASLDAVRRSRFTPGARTGCLYPYWRAAGTLAAPEPPSEESMRPAGATCPEHLPYARRPVLIYPPAYNRRDIEGWAVVAYDVAPWGAIGNVRVLAAEPSAEIGEAALNVIRNTTKATSTTGYVGCVDRVRFRIGDAARLKIDGQPVDPGPLPPPD